MEKILAEIAAERQRQDAKWGQQNHPSFRQGYPWMTAALMEHTAKMGCGQRFAAGVGDWSSILAEEFAEACNSRTLENLKSELIQVAAVCVAWYESIERNGR